MVPNTWIYMSQLHLDQSQQHWDSLFQESKKFYMYLRMWIKDARSLHTVHPHGWSSHYILTIYNNNNQARTLIDSSTMAWTGECSENNCCRIQKNECFIKLKRLCLRNQGQEDIGSPLIQWLLPWKGYFKEKAVVLCLTFFLYEWKKPMLREEKLSWVKRLLVRWCKIMSRIALYKCTKCIRKAYW